MKYVLTINIILYDTVVQGILLYKGRRTLLTFGNFFELRVEHILRKGRRGGVGAASNASSYMPKPGATVVRGSSIGVVRPATTVLFVCMSPVFFTKYDCIVAVLQ